MKPLRFSVFRNRAAVLATFVTVTSGAVYGQNLYFDASSTDWSIASAWSTATGAVTPDPANPPGAPGAIGANAFLGTTALTGVRSVDLNGSYTLGMLATSNLTGLVTVEAGSGGNRTLTLNSFPVVTGSAPNQVTTITGINHLRGGLTIGSTVDGKKINLLLAGSQVWNSATTGAGTLQALFILNDVSIGSGGNQTLTLAGSNTGSKIEGAISDGAGILGLTKNGSGATPASTLWTINGPVSYSGPTKVDVGILRLNSTANLNTSSITMGANTTLGLAAGGEAGMPNSKLQSLITTGVFPTSSTLELNTTGPVFLPTTNPLQANFSKSGASELTLAGVSSRTTTTAISAGILRLRDLQSGGVPSAIGASTSDANNFRFASNTRLIYDGPATTSDRLLNLSGTFNLESTGTGPLQLTNTGTHPGSTGSRTVVLLGSNRGDNLIAGSLGARTDSGLTKRGNGIWRISGTQPVMTGTTAYRVEEGQLTFDYSTGNDPCSPVSLVVNGGTTIFKGNGTATADTIPTLSTGTTIISQFDLKLRNGFALTVDKLTGNQSQRNDLIDLYDPVGNPSNSLTVNGLNIASPQGTLGVINNMIMVNATTNAGRASTVVRAQDGTYGFLALSNGTSGTVQKLSGLTQRTPAQGALVMNSDTTNYLLREGSYTGSGNFSFSTITMDAANGPILINVGNGEFRPLGQGKGLLFSGDNNIEILGNFGNNSAGDDTATWFHNYLETGSSLLLNVGLGTASQTVIFGGTGLTTYSGSGFVGNFVINGGVFRYTKDQAIPLGSNSPIFKVGSGAVLEIGARLQAQFISDADLVKTVGSGAGGIRLYGDAGLSAHTATAGGTRIAFFSNIGFDGFGDPVLTPQPLTWGAGYFLTISETENNTDGDNALRLSSDVSNAMIEVRNTIYLNGKSRVVEVANGSATIDARLSGSLMGLATPGDIASGIVKRGPGTLQLNGVNMYQGETRVMEGTLMIDSASLATQSRLWIDSGAKLHINLGSTVNVSAVFIDGVQYFGTVTHPSIIGGGALVSSAPLTPYAQWVVDKALGTSESAPTYDADFDGIRNLMEYAVGSEPKTPNGSVFAITGSAPRQIKFNHPSGRTDITIYLEASPTLAAPWTTIATSTVGAAFTSSVANVTVSEVSNQVSVTDSRTPAAPVMFYRLRVEK